MVQLHLFENSAKDQALRTLIALTIIVISDFIYQLLITRSFSAMWKNIYGETLPDCWLGKNILAWVNVWITLALVFGVSVLHRDSGDIKPEINNESIKDHAFYGILIGLLVYVPLNNWLVGKGQITNVESLCNTAFGILIASVACLCTFLISVQSGLFNA